MRSLMQHRRDEDGAVVAIVVLSLIAIFGMVVISVDVGGVVLRRREMVNVNDSAALAAAIAFAQKENGAECGVTEDPAAAAADQIAVTNVTGSARVSFVTDCVNQTVSVVYKKDQQLFFAPVLGFGDTATVNAAATAKWGQATGGNPVPIELDPQRTNNCVYVDPNDPTQGFKPPGACPDGYWFDPGATLQNSAWGLLSLNEWAPDNGANDWNAGCDTSGGTSDLNGWITQTNAIQVSLRQVPTYVCTRNGVSSNSWFGALASMQGKTVLFPVNDPCQMAVTSLFPAPCGNTQKLVNNTSKQKFAIVAFAPMKIEGVYRGNTIEAIGTPGTAGQSGDCGNNGAPLALDAGGGRNLSVVADNDCNAPVYTSIDHIPFLSVSVFSPHQGQDPLINYVKCPPVGGTSCDYRYDETTFQLTWVNNVTRSDGRTKMVQLNWSIDATPGTPGACSPSGTGGVGPTQPEARAYCLVLSWAGPQLIGQDPGPPGPGYGANAVTLVK